MEKNKGFFISGTDTDVGKTLVSAVMVNKLDALYWKPIQCGVDEYGFSDSDKIYNLLNIKKSRIFPEKQKSVFLETSIIFRGVQPKLL